MKETETEPEPEPNPYSLSGLVGEDKLCEGAGENQVIAGMLLLATKLGVTAVSARKFFKKAVIFGQSRVDMHKAIMYKMVLNFEDRSATVTKGDKPVDIGDFLSAIKHLLENPHNII